MMAFLKHQNYMSFEPYMSFVVLDLHKCKQLHCANWTSKSLPMWMVFLVLFLSFSINPHSLHHTAACLWGTGCASAQTQDNASPKPVVFLTAIHGLIIEAKKPIWHHPTPHENQQRTNGPGSKPQHPREAFQAKLLTTQKAAGLTAFDPDRTLPTNRKPRRGVFIPKRRAFRWWIPGGRWASPSKDTPSGSVLRFWLFDAKRSQGPAVKGCIQCLNSMVFSQGLVLLKMFEHELLPSAC